MNIVIACGTVIAGLLPSLFTVAFGAYILQRYFVSKANEALFIDTLFDELNELKENSLEYWSIDRLYPNPRSVILENKMKGAIRSISSDIRFLGQKTNTDEFRNCLMEVSDACTGGSFESTPAGPPDPSRYLLVVNAVSRLKSELLRLKL